MMRAAAAVLAAFVIASEALVQPPCSRCAQAGSMLHHPIRLHAHAIPAMLRGGGGAAKAEKKPQEVARTSEAIAFFGSERIPAAFLSGASLSLMFAFPLSQHDPLHLAASKRLYTLLASVAFCNEIIAVFASSLGIARLMSQGHNAMADSAITMMLREVPLYFLAARTHFLSGLLFFVGALAIRMWAYFSDDCPMFARGMTFLMRTTAAFMLSLFNSSLTHSVSFGDMWVQYLGAIFSTVRREGLGPIALVGFGCFLATAWELSMVSVYLAFMGLKKHKVVEA